MQHFRQKKSRRGFNQRFATCRTFISCCNLNQFLWLGFSSHRVLLILTELDSPEELEKKRICRIITRDFPQYFAVVSRIKQDSHLIGPEGGVLSSTLVPQVQAVFPEGALTKKIRVGLQVHTVVTREPIDCPWWRQQFFQFSLSLKHVFTLCPVPWFRLSPLTLTWWKRFLVTKRRSVQLSRWSPDGGSSTSQSQWQYQFQRVQTATGRQSSVGRLPHYVFFAASQVYLLQMWKMCRNITSVNSWFCAPGGTTPAQWEDITGSTPLTFVNQCVSFTTNVSAR